MSLKDLERVAIPVAALIGLAVLIWKSAPRECAQHAMFYVQGTSLDCATATAQKPSM